MLEEAFARLYGTERHSLTLDNIMGMYDRAPNFEDEFHAGDRMVLMGLKYEGTVQTRVGPAEKVTVELVTRDSYPDVLTFSALGVGFAAQAKAAVPADFPHVAEYARVRQPSGNEVKRFVPVNVAPKAWVDGDDGPAADIPHADPDTNGGGDTPPATRRASF